MKKVYEEPTMNVVDFETEELMNMDLISNSALIPDGQGQFPQG